MKDANKIYASPNPPYSISHKKDGQTITIFRNNPFLITF